MMSNEDFRDRILTCRECGQEFTFSVGEQEFFARKGLTNTPSRCPSCRAAHRGGQSTSASRSPRGPVEYHETTCAICGRPASVPFVPREDRPVYCSECFQTQRASRGGGGGRYDDRSYAPSGGRDRRDRRDSGRDRRDRW